ncbi:MULTISPECIES: thermonuclease family protein [unclassified Synechococcus]|nr:MULTISPECIES: thermonuclease family protein [unclassified Synechococcus]
MTIRLGCIDAPEMAQAPFGASARSYLQKRLRVGSTVTLKPQAVDRYGRTVAEVIGEVNINRALVENGQAFAYRKYLGKCDAKAYLEAEDRASRRRHGVWQVPGGITRPWDFRRSRRGVTMPNSTTPGGRRYRCSEIGSYARAQELLRQGHNYLDGNGDGEACESLAFEGRGSRQVGISRGRRSLLSQRSWRSNVSTFGIVHPLDVCSISQPDQVEPFHPRMESVSVGARLWPWSSGTYELRLPDPEGVVT